MPVTPLTPPRTARQERPHGALSHRGRHHLHLPGGKPAASAAEIVIETLAAEVSERGATRMDDKTSDARWKSARKTGIFNDKTIDSQLQQNLQAKTPKRSPISACASSPAAASTTAKHADRRLLVDSRAVLQDHLAWA